MRAFVGVNLLATHPFPADGARPVRGQS